MFIGQNANARNSTGRLLNNSILIGNNAKFPNASITDYDYAIGIGADVDVDCNNCMVLGGNTPARPGLAWELELHPPTQWLRWN